MQPTLWAILIVFIALNSMSKLYYTFLYILTITNIAIDIKLLPVLETGQFVYGI